jgi:hydroxyethylthiazole kinase
MDAKLLGACLDDVRESAPLVHCITNYVTVNDCANAVLAVGASPIMSDEPEDVGDISAICDGLDLNIGTLNRRSIDAMDAAATRAGELRHKMVLDPVGAGASSLRTQTARTLLELRHPTLVRGNMSEVKALSGADGSTRGVDVAPTDATNEENLAQAAAFVRGLSRDWGCVVAVTGAIDLVSDGRRTLANEGAQSTLDSIIPGLLPLVAIFVIYYIMKNVTQQMQWISLGIIAVGLILALIGLC